MPLNQILMYILFSINIYSNFFLCRFLMKTTANSTALNETDKEYFDFENNIF